MPTEDKNTIDCTFRHSQAQFDIQSLHPSIPPLESTFHPSPPVFSLPFPIFQLWPNMAVPRPNITPAISTLSFLRQHSSREN